MNGGKVSRMTAMVALMVAVLMFGTPTAFLGGMDADPVDVASAADGTRLFKIGVVDMTVSTLNPNTYTMVAEGMIIFPLYSYLIQWDSEGDNVIGDLAYDWHISPDGLTWEFDLVETAYFVDPRNPTAKDHQVTSEDVEWSVLAVASDTSSRLNSYWPAGMIEDTWTDGPFHFGITISEPFVPMMDSVMGNPILPKYYWESQDFTNFDNNPPIGSGPFYYATDGLPDDGKARLVRNEIWHGETSYGWQLHVDEFLMLRQDDPGTCWSAVIAGEVDAMMGVDPGVFVNDLPTHDNLVGFHQSNGFVYEFNLNQMTDANRKIFGGPLNAGSNSQLLLNLSVKTAISMAVDRYDLIDDVLYGYGEWTTTLVPSQNPMSHSYGQDGHDCIGSGVLDPIDRVAARGLLWDAGWRYDEAGVLYDRSDLAFADVCPLYNASASDSARESLSFEFLTLDTTDTWQIMANKIVGWCEDVGVELNLDIRSVNEMNTAWYAADYDVWLWDWVFAPYLEAASAVLVVLTTGVIGTDSDIYMSDPEFDALYEQAIREMDFDTRKEILYDMQDIVYLNRGCQALAFREDLYAFNTGAWDNFGELNTSYYLLPDVWPTWLCMRMNPTDNAAPVISGLSVDTNTADVAEAGVAVTFTAIANDDYLPAEDLSYTWIMGFGGEKVETGATDTIDYTFTTDGVYTVTLVVSETAPANGHADYFSSYMTYDITVHDMSNNAPHSLEIVMDPLDPDTGTSVSFTGVAVDDEDDELYYSWNFGDGSTASGQVVEHQFDVEGSWTVTLSVDDHRYGEIGSRPATLDTLVVVGPNHPPSISVPPLGSRTVKEETTYSVTASDADPRDEILYTWDWGDGTDTSETLIPSATHTYDWKGSYVVTVYADDQTGLPGHIDSDWGTVYIVGVNKVPVVATFGVNDANPFVYQTVTFSATALDGDGDPLTFTFEFGDGTTAEESFGATGPNDIVACSVDKEYTTASTFSAYVHVSDGIATTTSLEVSVTVQVNEAPVIESFDPLPYYDTGVPMTFSVVAIDYDDDDLTYTWNWGDGTTDDVTTTATTTHTFADSDTYTVSVTVDDGKGLEDVANADVTVNWVPWIELPLSPSTINQGDEYTYSVTASDNDTDSLTIMWDFGGGTDYEYGPSVTHTYADIDTYTCTVYVWDAFLEYRLTHNVSSAALITVKDPSVDAPPTVTPIDDIYAVIDEEIEFWVYATDDNAVTLTITWDFGDGSDLVVGQPPMYHTYVADGEYTLNVSVYDESGIPENNVSVEATVYVAADLVPIADAGGDREVDEDVAVSFTGAASTDDFPIPTDGYAWTVNDYDGIHTYDTMVFEHTFDMPGVWAVELVVTDSIGQLSDPDVIDVTVLDVTNPTADAGDDQEVNVGSTVTFDGSGTDNVAIVSYTWTFYDGVTRTLTGESPSYLFDAIDDYTVRLRVEDAAGNFAEDTMLVVVADLEDPVADAGTDQTVTEGATVTFAGSGTDNVAIVSYTWAFDYDGSEVTRTGTAPTFDFVIPGVYVVTLTVADEAGNEGTDTVTITVEAAPVANEAPVADAGDDQPVTVGDEVTFDGSGSSDSDGTIDNYTWSFTYNAVAKEIYGESATFDFDIVGTYEVTLTVTDDDDATDTDTMTVTVQDVAPTNDAPVADAGAAQTVIVGVEVTFTGSASTDSDGTIANYTWTFTYDGETETLYGVSPKFTFEIAKAYTVTLTVTDDDGATDTDTVTITVEEEDDEKSFLESYGLPIGIVIALIVAALVAFFVMKGRKGGKPEAEELESMSAGEPEVPEDQS
jgi:ABC-type transport system substrate-binding protein/PKD repeat protein